MDGATKAVQPLTLSQLCSRVPGARGRKPLSPATPTRWILHGCPDRSGQRIKLKATRAGGRWLVYESDLQHFFDLLGADPTSTPSRSPAQRTRDSEAAGNFLDTLA